MLASAQLVEIRARHAELSRNLVSGHSGSVYPTRELGFLFARPTSGALHRSGHWVECPATVASRSRKIRARDCQISAYDYNKWMEHGSAAVRLSWDELPPILTVEEVADLMRVDRKTAYAAIAGGEVPGVRRVGRCIRISRDVLLEWLADGEGTPTRKRRR